MHAALRILLVEDNPDALKFFAEVLKIFGYRVDSARDGAEALGKALHARYDLIATELDRSRQSGLDLIGELRTREASEGRDPTPIIVVTAQDRPEVRERALSLGANAFVAKPVRSRELVTAVRTHIDDRTAVLVCDDAEQNRALVSTWLKQLPRVRVMTVDRAGAAIACVKRERIDFVLLDMVMPGIDGYAAARLLRAVPDAKELPIVAMTAKVGDDEREACLAAGCSDYLPKPIDRGALLELVDRLSRLERGTAQRARPAQGELDAEYAALVPAFLEKRQAEILVLEEALATREFDTLYRLGHNLRGSGGSYGFPLMTEIGARMETAAKANDRDAVAREIDQLREHLSEVLRQLR